MRLWLWDIKDIATVAFPLFYNKYHFLSIVVSDKKMSQKLYNLSKNQLFTRTGGEDRCSEKLFQ